MLMRQCAGYYLWDWLYFEQVSREKKKSLVSGSDVIFLLFQESVMHAMVKVVSQKVNCTKVLSLQLQVKYVRRLCTQSW